MKKEQFSIVIDAPRETVWKTLWEDATYREWTAPFNADSHAVTDWKKGSKVLFLDGNNSGMVATIADNIPYEHMSIRHLGMVENGNEITDTEEVRQWAGALENYTLKTVDGKTKVIVDTDITDEYRDMFMDIWPKALQKLKEISERQS